MTLNKGQIITRRVKRLVRRLVRVSKMRPTLLVLTDIGCVGASKIVDWSLLADGGHDLLLWRCVVHTEECLLYFLGILP